MGWKRRLGVAVSTLTMVALPATAAPPGQPSAVVPMHLQPNGSLIEFGGRLQEQLRAVAGVSFAGIWPEGDTLVAAFAASPPSEAIALLQDFARVVPLRIVRVMNSERTLINLIDELVDDWPLVQPMGYEAAALSPRENRVIVSLNSVTPDRASWFAQRYGIHRIRLLGARTNWNAVPAPGLACTGGSRDTCNPLRGGSTADNLKSNGACTWGFNAHKVLVEPVRVGDIVASDQFIITAAHCEADLGHAGERLDKRGSRVRSRAPSTDVVRYRIARAEWQTSNYVFEDAANQAVQITSVHREGPLMVDTPLVLAGKTSGKLTGKVTHPVVALGTFKGMVGYDMQTADGDSGAPVYTPDKKAVAIHSGSEHDVEDDSFVYAAGTYAKAAEGSLKVRIRVVAP